MRDDPWPDDELKKPQLRLLLAAWGGISLLVVTCILVASAFSQTNGISAASEPVPTPLPAPAGSVEEPVDDGAFGYGIQVRPADPPGVEASIMMVNQLGLDWVKRQVRWSNVQPAPDEFVWDGLDAFMAQASGANLNVLLSIVSAPEWSRSSTSSGRTGPPDDFQTYVDFVTTVLERYPGEVSAIEVWNEQNLQREWYSVGGLSATRYVEMLALTYDAVQAVDPDVIVVSGALSPTGVNDGIVAIDDFDYLDQMIDAGLLANTDCVGAHHTGVNLPPDVTAEEAFEAGAPLGTVFMGPYDADNPLNPHHSWSFRSTLRGQYDKIVAAGGTQKLCVTEFGWPSMEGLGAEEAPPDFAFAWDNSLAEQAAYSVQAYQLLREWDIAQMAFLWNLDFQPQEEGQLDDNVLYSIIAPDGTPRPAFHAIAAMPKD